MAPLKPQRVRALVWLLCLPILLAHYRAAWADGGRTAGDQDSNDSESRDDDWSTAVRRGMGQEGRLSQEEQVEHERRHMTEVKRARGDELRMVGYAGLGPFLGYKAEHFAIAAALELGARLRLHTNWELQPLASIHAMHVGARAIGAWDDWTCWDGRGGCEEESGLVVNLSIDALVRYRPGAPSSPWYVGLGPRVGFYAGLDDHETAGGSIAAGYMLGDQERFDLGARFILDYRKFEDAIWTSLVVAGMAL